MSRDVCKIFAHCFAPVRLPWRYRIRVPAKIRSMAIARPYITDTSHCFSVYEGRYGDSESLQLK